MVDINTPVACPSRIDTGVVRGFRDSKDENLIKVALDLLGDDVYLTAGEVKTFRWKHHSKQGNYLVIARAWCGFFGGRNLKVQTHRIRDDGSVGGRAIIIHRVNGKPKRFGW
jgi:hypothetical protein